MVTTLWENSNTANVFYWMAGGGWKINGLPLVDKEIEMKPGKVIFSSIFFT